MAPVSAGKEEAMICTSEISTVLQSTGQRISARCTGEHSGILNTIHSGGGVRWLVLDGSETPSVEYAITQLALLANLRDQQEHGTAPWDELDHAVHEEYLADARMNVLALQTLGWGPWS
jgi:hypothetical protein